MRSDALATDEVDVEVEVEAEVTAEAELAEPEENGWDHDGMYDYLFSLDDFGDVELDF